MSELDDFVASVVRPQLRQGEVLFTTGWMCRGALDGEFFLAGATNQRLIAIACGKTVMTGAPSPTNHGVQVFELHQLRGFASQDGHLERLKVNAAKHITLTAPNGEQAHFAIPTHSWGMAGQYRLYATWADWIARHHAAGSFFSEQGVAAMAAELGDLAALEARQRQESEARAREVKAAEARKPPRWPYAIMALLLLGLALPGFMIVRSVDQLGKRTEDLERFSKQIAAAKKKDPEDRSTTEAAWVKNESSIRAATKRDVEHWESNLYLSVGAFVGVLAAAAGMLVLGKVLARKKTAENQAAART